MLKVNKTVLVPYTQKQMFDLVANVEQYPAFLPWCSQAEILSQQEQNVVARLYIHYFKVKHHFTTRNQNVPSESITIALEEGPFRHLEGHWKFIALGEQGCKIDFSLSYDFSNKLLEKLIGPVFHHISSTLVDAFITQAEKVYVSTP